MALSQAVQLRSLVLTAIGLVNGNPSLPRDAMLSAVYAVVVCLSVCVCLSVTLRYCIKTAKRRISQIMPHDITMTLVFWCQRS